MNAARLAVMNSDDLLLRIASPHVLSFNHQGFPDKVVLIHKGPKRGRCYLQRVLNQ